VTPSKPLRACPLPLWAFAATLLILEFAGWAWLTRHGVEKQWWSDLQGGLLLFALPLFVRLLILISSYTVSRAKGVSIKPEQRLSAFEWLHFFAEEYFYFCLQSLLLIPFRAFFHTATEAGRGPSRGDVIVLQHGFMHSGAVWYFTARALERMGYRVFAVDQPLYASIDWMAQRLHEGIEKAIASTGAPQVTLIAHSMGGLIARAYLRQFGNARIKKLITVGSPHRGTWHAQIAGGTNGRQMRRGNAWLEALSKVKVTVPFTSIYSVHDTIISPQDSSRLPEADNIELHGIGHVSMPSGRRMRAHIIAAMGN
jgi:predicted alpha/beta hydrolase family esterase